MVVVSRKIASPSENGDEDLVSGGHCNSAHPGNEGCVGGHHGLYPLLVRNAHPHLPIPGPQTVLAVVYSLVLVAIDLLFCQP